MELSLTIRLGATDLAVRRTWSELFVLHVCKPSTWLVIITLFLAWRILRPYYYPVRKSAPQEPDPREPTVLHPRLPIIGHIVGFLRHRSFYIDELVARCPSPIFSIKLVGCKVHIITDPPLAAAMSVSSSVSSKPIMEIVASSIMRKGPKSSGLLGAPVGQDVVNEYIDDMKDSMQESRGSGLDKMQAQILSRIADMVNMIGCTYEEQNLWHWLEGPITYATSEALFGVYHPLGKDLGLVQSVWSHLTTVFRHKVSSYLPWYLQQFPILRPKIQIAFKEFYADPDRCLHPTVSSSATALLRNTYKHGVPESQTAHSAHKLLFQAATNTLPTIYWALLYLFSNPTLVGALREHISRSGIVSSVCALPGKPRRLRINHTSCYEECPHLIEAYNEVLRLTSFQSGARVVLVDCVVGGATSPSDPKEKKGNGDQGYVLEKGTMILAPSHILHQSISTWGHDARKFKPSRWEFLTKKQEQAFIPFGSGKSSCPGRELATTEVLGMIAVLLLGFDVVGKDGGRLKMPGGRETGFGVARPDEEGKRLGILIKRRRGWEDVIWGFGNGK